MLFKRCLLGIDCILLSLPEIGSSDTSSFSAGHIEHCTCCLVFRINVYGLDEPHAVVRVHLLVCLEGDNPDMTETIKGLLQALYWLAP